MASVKINDHAVWVRHVKGGDHITQRIGSLSENAPITLQVDGRPVLFRKMRNGSDGRPTAGIRPDDSFKDYWTRLYNERRGEELPIELDDAPYSDPYLSAVSALLTEWDSPEDNAAYNDL